MFQLPKCKICILNSFNYVLWIWLVQNDSCFLFTAINWMIKFYNIFPRILINMYQRRMTQYGKILQDRRRRRELSRYSLPSSFDRILSDRSFPWIILIACLTLNARVHYIRLSSLRGSQPVNIFVVLNSCIHSVVSIFTHVIRPAKYVTKHFSFIAISCENIYISEFYVGLISTHCNQGIG